jgi:ABC-type transport system substrate-binding protein
MVASGGAALGAAILSACGGDDDGGGGGGGGAGLIYKPVDQTKQAKRGGIIKASISNDIQGWNIHAPFPTGPSLFLVNCASQLTRYKPGLLQDPELGSIGDVAQSWEYSPDKLTLTMKLHPQAKWSPLSPTFHQGVFPASVGNRTMDADDVVFSWERFSTTPTAIGRLDLVAETGGPVTGITKIDNSTVQFKLSRPFAALIQSFSNWEFSRLHMHPKEGRDGSIDWNKAMIGGGPYYVEKHTPGAGVFIKRNPNYELRDSEFKRPYADGVDLPLLQDPSQNIPQLKAGQIWNLPLFGARTEEIIQLKKDVPDILLTVSYNSDPENMRFAYGKDSPFKDIRVRQAMSYAWDRDQFIEIVHKIKMLQEIGIDTDVRWNAGLPCNETGMPNGTYKGWWLNPKSKDFGENAKYFTLGKTRADDIAEAKRLLTAAGFPNGVEYNDYFGFVFATTPFSIDVMHGIISEAGFKPTRKQLNMAEFLALPAVGPNAGNFAGTAIGIDGGGSHDPGLYIFTHYAKGGGFFFGFNPNDNGWSPDGDPEVNNFAKRALEEFDETARKKIVHDFQRYVAKYNYRPRYPGGNWTIEAPGQGTAFGAAWPVLANQNVWTGESFKMWWVSEWIDESKPPISKKA